VDSIAAAFAPDGEHEHQRRDPDAQGPARSAAP